MLYDLMDVKVYYNEMGGTDTAVSDALENLEEGVIDQHTHLLKSEMPAMLKNPIFQPYMEKLLNEYKKVDLISENEAKIFEGELKLQKFDEEMKNLKKKKIRGLGGMLKMGTGLDKLKIAQLFEYYNAVENDPIDVMLLMKMNAGDIAQTSTEKDSLMLLQRRQELQIELHRMKLDIHADEEKKFLIDKFAQELNLNIDSLPMPKTVIKPPKPDDPTSPTTKEKQQKTEKDDSKKKLSLAERRAKRLADKKEKAAEEKEKKKAVSKSKDKKEKDDKKDKDDKKKDDKKSESKKDDKKKDDKKKDDKKKDDKKSSDKKKDSKKSSDKKKDDKKSSSKKSTDKKSKK